MWIVDAFLANNVVNFTHPFQHNAMVLAFGERFIVITVLAVSQIMLGSIVYFGYYSKYLRRLVGLSCTTTHYQFEFNLLLVYVTALIITLWEMYIYISLSRFIHQMNLKMTGIISEQAQKNRKRKNAIDLFCHIMQFALECITLLTVLIFLATRDYNLFVATIALTLSSSGIISLILIGLSSSLKREFTAIFEASMTEVLQIANELILLWC